MHEAARTVFYRIAPWQQAIFYLLSLISLAVCTRKIVQHARLWRQGRPNAEPGSRSQRLASLWRQAAMQQKVRRRRYAGRAHLGIFFGFLTLFAGTCIVAVEHYGALLFGHHWLYRGWFYLLCKVSLDTAGLLLMAGSGMALARRLFFKPAALAQSAFDPAFLTLLFLSLLTGFLLEGAGLYADPRRAPWRAFSYVGRWFGAALPHPLSAAAYQTIWWIHAPIVLTLIALLPYGRRLHLFVIPASALLQPERKMGVLENVSLQQVEETGRTGAASAADFTKWERMSLEGCMGCGRCTEVCPAHAMGKPLNPQQIAFDLRSLLTQGEGENSTGIIADEALWACTNCHACVQECPALIRHVDLIEGIRRYRVGEGALTGSAAAMLRKLGSRENPWGLPNQERTAWADGLTLQQAEAGNTDMLLLWVGCAGAFDPQARKTVRALAELLQHANVPFRVLGNRERCTGDPARRTGDDFLYQQLAESNINTLKQVQAARIVTTCPHCMHTLKNEYAQMGCSLEVEHHTELLARLQQEGKLPAAAGGQSAVYHDPCFLARVNGVTEPPRAVLQSAVELKPAQRERERGFCCGAGGGRMWMEDDPAQRPGRERARELMATGAQTIATGCPFCKIMLSDSVAQQAGEQKAPPVRDVAELLLEALQVEKQ